MVVDWPAPVTGSRPCSASKPDQHAAEDGSTDPAATVSVKNVASVFITASLPPFARPGMQIDVTVSSIGDAKTSGRRHLVAAPLYAADGTVYAEAQGAVTLADIPLANRDQLEQVNHPTAGRIPTAIGGAGHLDRPAYWSGFRCCVRDPIFALSSEMAAAINREVGRPMATAVDSGRVELPERAGDGIVELMARRAELDVEIQSRAGWWSANAPAPLSWARTFV